MTTYISENYNYADFFINVNLYYNKHINIINIDYSLKYNKIKCLLHFFNNMSHDDQKKIIAKYVINENALTQINESTIIDNSQIHKLCLTIAKKIRDIYDKKFAFPIWVINAEVWNIHDFKETKVYYHQYDDINNVKLLIKEREPVNINMERHYNEDNMQSNFGWKIGAYNKSNENELMPNIAVYCYAIINEKETLNTLVNSKKIHVINLIGFAFDDIEQPDYKFFLKDKSWDDRKNDDVDFYTKLQDAYKKMWSLCMACAIDLKKQNKIDNLQIFNVGGNAFYNYETDEFIEKIFNVIYKDALVTPCNTHDIHLMGYDSSDKEFNGGYIPHIFFNEHKDICERTLYVNAWDPFTIIGNGNAGDKSLDGYFGRHSNMSVLGWSMTNPFMKFVSVD